MKIDKEIIEALKLEERTSLEETCNLQLVRILTDDSAFAVIKRTPALKKEARQWGCNEFVGRWVEQSDQDGTNTVISDVTSLLIKNISLKDACRLGAKYNQSSIVFKDGEKIEEICTTPFTDWKGNAYNSGDIINTFHVDPEHPLNSKIASEIFTGSNKKEFQLWEKYFLNAWSGFTYIPINTDRDN